MFEEWRVFLDQINIFVLFVVLDRRADRNNKQRLCIPVSYNTHSAQQTFPRNVYYIVNIVNFPPLNICYIVNLSPGYFTIYSKYSLGGKELGAIRAKIGPTSDVDKIFSKMYSQYVLFRNKYSQLICVSNSSQRINKVR